MKVLVTGATGFVGKKLLQQLTSPIVLTRNVESAKAKLGMENVEVYQWSPLEELAPIEALEKADAVVHLLGEPVYGKWTDAKREMIEKSRSVGTKNLVDAISKCSNPPKILVSASAVGIYGDRQEDELTEDAEPASGFLGDVCKNWEAIVAEANGVVDRTVSLRIGIVLGKEGGALKEMMLPFKMGVGGRLGSGKQWMPWISIDDLIGLILFSLKQENLSGPVNAVSPNPVRNSEFTKSFAKKIRRPAFIPVPAFGLRMIMGEFANVLLSSQRVIPKKAIDAGFQFRHAFLDEALESIL